MARKRTAEPAAEAAPARRKGSRRTTPSPETLAELDRDRLIALILGETARNPAFRKLVTAALAARQGPEAVAAMVDRRLAALEGAQGFIDWQKRRAFVADLDATVSVVLNELRPLDPEAALDRLLRFVAGSDAVLDRVDDGAGRVQGVYERASEAAVAIAAELPQEAAARFAEALLPRVRTDPAGPFGHLLRDLIAHLPPALLARVDAGLSETGGAKGGAKGGWAAGLHRLALLRMRQDIADRRGDVDGFIALEQAAMPAAPDRTAVAGRLLAAGRPEEALDWLRRPEPRAPRTRADLVAGPVPGERSAQERAALEIRALDALGRSEAAQALRWSHFAQTLDAAMLRAFLAKLPDFEDDAALEAAFGLADGFADRHRALAFLVGWPNLPRAARLVRAHPDAWDGERYGILAPAAEALAARDPGAASLLYRRLLDDMLGKGRSAAYAHGARYLRELDGLAPRIETGALDPDPATYRGRLRRAHGRKYGFWNLVGDPDS